jgi:predicted nucleic acid-binding protein
VVDTNVFIDVHRGGLLEAVFALPFVFLAPDVIVEELEVPDGKQLSRWGLESVSSSGEQVAAVSALAAVHRRPSVNDLFAFVVARAEGAMLLTGDGALRELAESEGMAVHGTLWLLDELVRLDIVRGRQAAEGLERMVASGRRLPESECQRRIQRWRAG